MHPGERIRLSSPPATASRPFRPGVMLAQPRRLGAIAAIGVLLVIAASAAALAHAGEHSPPAAEKAQPRSQAA